SMSTFLQEALADVLHLLQSRPGCALVGASGTFEVIDTIVSGELAAAPYSMFRAEEFYPMYRLMLRQDLEQRLANPAIPPSRARYIVVAMYLVAFILERVDHPVSCISAYAMKEGIILEMMDNFRLD
ncbi:MAG: hypothetical protein R3330_12815, partial [Saprospiraceae bacterium]|nr:hypothetical protein [Saprospiraceae bacterium]